jgi:hypothetical protein
VPNFACPATPVRQLAVPVHIGTPQVLLLCPIRLPSGQLPEPVGVSAGQPGFDVLVAALSRPDVPKSAAPKSGAVCLEYADGPQVVLAKAATRPYQVTIPSDYCGHYLRPAVNAINRARAR